MMRTTWIAILLVPALTHSASGSIESTFQLGDHEWVRVSGTIGAGEHFTAFGDWEACSGGANAEEALGFASLAWIDGTRMGHDSVGPGNAMWSMSGNIASAAAAGVTVETDLPTSKSLCTWSSSSMGTLGFEVSSHADFYFFSMAPSARLDLELLVRSGEPDISVTRGQGVAYTALDFDSGVAAAVHPVGIANAAALASKHLEFPNGGLLWFWPNSDHWLCSTTQGECPEVADGHPMLAHAEPGSEWDFTVLLAAETSSARQILGAIPFPPE